MVVQLPPGFARAQIQYHDSISSFGRFVAEVDNTLATLRGILPQIKPEVIQ